MKKKTLFIILGVVLVLIVLLVVGKKSGMFGKSGNFKQVEIAEIKPLDIVETVSARSRSEIII